MEYKISDLITDISMGPFGSKVHRSNYVENGVPYLNGGNLTGYKLNEQEFNFLTEEKADELGRAIAHRGDVIVTHRGTLGQIAYIPENSQYKRYVTGNSQFRFTCNGKIMPKYLVYYFHTPMGQHKLLSNASQVGVPALARPTTSFQKLVIDIPNLDYQERVVGFIDGIQEKIENNNEINKNLFQQMELLYRAWFTDFVPFEGSRPRNWKKSNIYSIADIIYGAPFSSKLFNTDGEGTPIIRIRDLKEQAFTTYTTEKHPKGYLIQPGDIIVGMDGEFRPYIWGNTEAWLNQRVCIFNNKRPKGKAFVLFTIKPLLYQIEQTQVATTVIHIGKKDYDAFEFFLPTNNILDQFDEITAPMIDQIVTNSLENKRLAELRDSLLPRLMSGELDVSALNL